MDATHTLLLSPHYEPLACCTWQQAMLLFFAGRVEVVEFYGDKTVRSATQAWSVPSVMRYKHAAFTWRKRNLKPSKGNIFVRDEGICQYCAHPVSKTKGTLDHVLPKSCGGGATWLNLVWCCYGCNQLKGARTPQDAGMALIRQPMRPEYLQNYRKQIISRREVPDSWHPYLRMKRAA